MHNDNLNKIKRLSQKMVWASGAVIVVLIGACVWIAYFSFVDFSFLAARYQGAAIDISLTPNWVRALVVVISWVSMGLLIYAVFCCFRMFQQFAKGIVFEAVPALWLRRTALTLFGLAIFTVIQNSANMSLLSLSNPAGKRLLSIGISSDQVAIAFFAGVFLVIAHVMVLASQVDEENKGFI